ncbi:aldolase [Halomicroarcula limicola]|uniref:Aldolase n=1 Tax=Haloarcula limicola TaxID=1429915 RepID=A0A8J7YCH5_9EURY|nr:aldolase/citrate lyase family protein [Halomicroarcula limicola]MBV0925923.1 aldolase [Halomicroarcula limicola]
MTHIKDAIEGRDYPFGTWTSIGHPAVAEGLAQLDLDFLLVDMEHTTMSLETVESMARAVDAAESETNAVVRVPWNDPVRLKRVIDIGIAGVMVPMIDDAEEARELVRSLRYPPDGIRGIAGSRATGYGRNFQEYVDNANGSILTIAQIETEAGLENAEEIARVDGIDALFVGPADLSAALGLFAEWDTDEFADAVESVIEAGNDAGTPVGTLTVDTDVIESRIEQGFDFLIAGKDISLLMDSVESARSDYEAALEAAIPASSD